MTTAQEKVSPITKQAGSLYFRLSDQLILRCLKMRGLSSAWLFYTSVFNFAYKVAIWEDDSGTLCYTQLYPIPLFGWWG